MLSILRNEDDITIKCFPRGAEWEFKYPEESPLLLCGIISDDLVRRPYKLDRNGELVVPDHQCHQYRVERINHARNHEGGIKGHRKNPRSLHLGEPTHKTNDTCKNSLLSWPLMLRVHIESQCI